MLHVDKLDSLLTEKVEIRASKLKPLQNYKFQLRLHSNIGIYRSYCILKSNQNGEIDLATGKPLRGTYANPDPMGLFLTVERTDDVAYGGRASSKDGKPLLYTLRLLSESQELLDEIHLKKRFLHPAVSEIEVKQHGIWGVIFKPPGPGPFPCIMDMPILSGKLYKVHAALFASEGFLTFCMPIFDEPGLPARMQDVDMEYISKHLKFVQSLPYCSDKIGLFGNSFGGTIAMHLATKHPELSAVVVVNGPEAFHKERGHMRENGRPMECEILNDSLSVTINGVVRQQASFMDLFDRLRPETSIHWDRIPKNVVFRVMNIIRSAGDVRVNAEDSRRSLKIWENMYLEILYKMANKIFVSFGHV